MLDDLEDPHDLRATLAGGATAPRPPLTPWNEDLDDADEVDHATDGVAAITTDAETAHGQLGAGAPVAQIAPRRRVIPTAAREWVSPGVSLRKRWLTGLGVALAAVLFFWLALHEGATMVVSTLIGVVFIGGFVGYLWVVAPTPFTIRLDGDGVTRTDRGAEPISIRWENIAKVKEEVYRSGVSVSVTVYKKVGARGLHRAYVVYRDDIPHFDDFAAALDTALLDETPWQRETIHE